MKQKSATKICKYCKSEIPSDAKVCPNCRRKQGMGIGKIIALVLVVFLLFGCVGMFMGGDSEERQTVFKQNETATYKDVDYKVSKVKKSSGTEYDTPKKGHEYVIVTISIKNNSDEKISYNELDWKMENSKGQEDDVEYITLQDTDTSLDSGDLKPGGTKKGTIVFEEPKNDKELTLNYYYNSLFDDEPTFQIKLDE